MPPFARIYQGSSAGADLALRQCEFLSDVVQAHLLLAERKGGQFAIHEKIHPYAVVLTQDCDLTQDFDARRKVEDEKDAVKQEALRKSDKIIPSVLLCSVVDAATLSVSTKDLGSRGWERIRQNKDERYHFLERVDGSCDARQIGLGELAIDFKRYFTVPMDELYWRIEVGQTFRRCYLESPYLEHLSTRFAYFLSRVALPEPHTSV